MNTLYLKGWLGESTPTPSFPALYRTYQHSLYSSMSRLVYD